MSPWCNIHPIRSGRGIQEAQVWEAADLLLHEGLRPTIERVRQKIGSGSPNTVSPMLERWFATLGKRLDGHGANLADGEAHQLPLAVVQAAKLFWESARREADQVQVQKTEAARREIELQRGALAQKEADLQQRETSFEQARVALDEALASSRQAVTAMEAQMHAQQQESARLLSDSEAEVRRLRKALEEAVASKEALREKAAMEIGAAHRDAREAEQRHVAHERRLLADVDRERVAARQATADLAKEQKARAADLEAARGVQAAAKQALQVEKAAHSDAAAERSRQQQEMRVELATLRERAAGAEHRAADLTAQLQRQQRQAEREIAQLRESHAATAAALRQLEAHARDRQAASLARPKKSTCVFQGIVDARFRRSWTSFQMNVDAVSG
ncbi:DNA-binding protein [Variovorax ginsengisoli]|uniref:DNA-binding protein n=2 Tax=Variovorax ginsengisoli TaxID=363844 RepID=A0ABT8SKJ3_9BURK|nr:DNA-binding protein [Variovorax ginsengisoli]MDN8618931.1 DNA-binding protein [Variovorax ginsengisoli]MDO1538101.1 DNA-binding protein [Variovorax ginsengisoli]